MEYWSGGVTGPTELVEHSSNGDAACHQAVPRALAKVCRLHLLQPAANSRVFSPNPRSGWPVYSCDPACFLFFGGPALSKLPR